MNRVLSKHTGQDLDTIATDTDRDNFMDGNAAVEYGLIDQVMQNRLGNE